MATNRMSFSPLSPYREKRPTTNKIIFISCEGSVTEEEYFQIISQLYQNIKTQVQLISVVEDIIAVPKRRRNQEQKRTLTKSKPDQLLDRIEIFKQQKDSIYDFEKHPDDEFWIIADVDDHTEEYYIDKWNQTLRSCQEKHYHYAVSNPFFELWLLLHHTDVDDTDYDYAVTEEHQYEKTDHFRKRLQNAGAKLKKKSIIPTDYSKGKIQLAIQRAEKLHNKSEDWPRSLGTTVYLLLNSIEELDSQC